MYLDYSKLEASQIKQPALRLQTLAGKELGVIPWVSNLNFELNYADVSRVEFDVPRHSDGKINPVYHLLTSYKMLFTEQLGIYILQRPATSGDGVSEVKHIIPVYWHSLRHFFTTSLAKANLPDSVIKTIIGWESLEMVDIYKDIDDEDEIGKYCMNGEIVGQKQAALSDL